jgi:hypothetical protein
MKIPKEVTEVIAKIYNTPIFKSARAIPGDKGITPITIITGIIIIMGAMINKNLSDPLGIKFSLNKRDIKSAIGCNNPNGPHLFGPILV